MLNDESTEDSELQIEVTPESESPESSQNTDGEGEIEDTPLNLEEEEPKADKPNSAEENAKRQEQAWLLKVTSGKASVEDAPKWLQSRLNAKLEATAPDTEELVRKALEKQQEDAEFKKEKDSLPRMSPAQAKEFQERYASLRPAGKLTAIRTVKEIMGMSEKYKEAEQRGMAKGKVSFPRSGQPSVKKSEQLVGGVPLDVIQDDAKWNRMVLQGQQD